MKIRVLVASLVTLALVVGLVFVGWIGRDRIVGFFTTGQPAVTAVKETWTVVPGKSIGPLALYQSRADVLQIMGFPGEGSDDLRWIYGTPDDPWLSILFSFYSGDVTVIEVFHTPLTYKGIHTGRTTLEDVFAILGKPEEVFLWEWGPEEIHYVILGYMRIGLAVAIDPTSRLVTGFIVFPPQL